MKRLNRLTLYYPAVAALALASMTVANAQQLTYTFDTDVQGFENFAWSTNGPAGWAGGPAIQAAPGTNGGWTLGGTYNFRKEFSGADQPTMQSLVAGGNGRINFDVVLDGSSFVPGVANWYQINIAGNSAGANGWTQVGGVTGNGWHNADDATLVSTNVELTFSQLGWANPEDATGWFQIFFGANSASDFPIKFYIDNVIVKAYEGPPPPPPTMGLAKAGPSGVQITMDNNTDQWQRNAISTGTNGNPYLWTSQGSYPVTYSCTIADFPDIASHQRYEAHMYLVNGDTGGGNQVNGATDWASPDIFIFRVENAGSGVIAQIQWKTNFPNANATNVPVVVNAPSALGTWSVTFTDSTNGTLTGPGITATNFTLPEDVVVNNFSSTASYLQFGMFKNDEANDGHNNQTHGTFSRVKFTGAAAPFDDTFNGPTLTNNFPWRKTSASAVQHVPPGTTWWVNWTLPDTGFNLQGAATAVGPWADAGTSTYQSAGKSYASVAATGDAAYFRLIKRPFTQLQVLLPGETAAPGTVTGKTGTPTPITISSGSRLDVTVRACDPDWNLINVGDTINLTTDEPSAELPAANVAMVNGVATFTGVNSILLTAAGNWTVTATNISKVMPAANSSPVTVTP